MVRVWLEYKREKDLKEILTFLRKMNGKVIKNYRNIKYLYVDFKARDVDFAEIILETIKKCKLIKNVKKDIKMTLNSIEIKRLREEDIIQPEHYLRGLDIIGLKNFTGKGITVAILDSGVKKKCFPKKKIINYNGEDKIGHGTAISDIIFQIAPNINLISYNIVRSGKEIEAYDVVEKLEEIGNNPNVKIINMSFGGEEIDDGTSPIAKMVDYIVRKKKKIVVVASGNLGSDGVSYPASAKEAITVGSIDKNDRVSEFSGYGRTRYGTKPDIVAYGENVLVRTIKNSKIGFVREKNMAVVSGTSFSAPMVTGIIALLLEAKKNCKIKTLKEAIFKTAIKRSKLKGLGLARYIRNIILKLYTKMGIGFLLKLLDINEIEYEMSIGHGKIQGLRAYNYLKNKC